MTSPAMKMDETDLKERILLAAIEEFGKHGFESASTNSIVKHAGVSKGLLFHYYCNKNNLFLEAAFHVLDILARYVEDNFSMFSPDLFARLEQVMGVKMDFYREYPLFMGMLSQMWHSDKRREIDEHMKKRHGTMYREQNIKRILKGVDKSKLNDNLSLEALLGYASLMIEACWLRMCTKYDHNYTVIAMHVDEYLADISSALELIKLGAYKR